MNKKGLSGVVTAVLIILLAIVAIGIIWFYIQNLITGAGDDLIVTDLTISLDVERAEILENGNLKLRVKSISGSADKLRVVAYNFEGEAISFLDENGLAELQQRTLEIDFVSEGLEGKVERVEVYPIITDDGRDKIGRIGFEKKVGDFENSSSNNEGVSEESDEGNVVDGEDNPDESILESRTLDYLNLISDIYAEDDDGFNYQIQLKYDISSLSGEETIESADACFYLSNLAGETVDRDVSVWYVADQNWDDSIQVPDFHFQDLSIQTNGIFSNLNLGEYSCFDVSSQLQEALGDNYFTLRFEDPDRPMEITSVLYVSNNQLSFSDDGTASRISFSSKEVSAVNQRPYLDIKYKA